MSSAMAYGGWFSDFPSSTGGSFGFVQIIGWMVAASTAFAGIGTASEPQIEAIERSPSIGQHVIPIADTSEVSIVRTPKEDLARIREVLSPAVSDLASTLGVTRQSVYNWLNGSPIADENAAKLCDLAQAVDVLVHEGVTINAALLKRKFAQGKTLFQVAKAGMSARDAALLFVQIHKREVAQRERLAARVARPGRSHATADFDLPVSNDNA